MDLDQVFREISEQLEATGGSIRAGYSPQPPDGGPGRWEVVLTYGNPQGRDTLTNVGVGQTFLEALDKVMTAFREG